MFNKMTCFVAALLAGSWGINTISNHEISNLKNLFTPAANAKEHIGSSSTQLSGQKLLERLQQGGTIIYFRHATTERDYADQADPNMSLANCETQRKLSLQGIKESYAIGIAFAEKKIPIGDIITSEYCRAWKTANYAFGGFTKKDSRLNFLPYEDYTDDLTKLMKKNLLPMLSKKPIGGMNTIIVGHDDLFEAATGIYPEPQGIAYIIEPYGNDLFKLIARVLPSEWQQL